MKDIYVGKQERFVLHMGDEGHLGWKTKENCPS